MDEQLVQRVVSWMLKQHRWMEEYRSDLEQEARLAYIEARGSYSMSKGMSDEESYCFFKMKHAIQNYMRKEMRHFKKPEEDHDSPYWDLDKDVVNMDLIPAEEEQGGMGELMDMVQAAGLTMRQREVLDTYLSLDDIPATAATLGITEQGVKDALGWVVKKCKKVE